MIQNDKLDAAILLIAQVIGERTIYLRKEGLDPPVLINELSNLSMRLQACISEEELRYQVDQLPCCEYCHHYHLGHLPNRLSRCSIDSCYCLC